MSELAVAVLRMGLLLALWVLIISIVMAQGRDLVVGRRNKTRLQQAQRDAGLVTAVPAAGACSAGAASASRDPSSDAASAAIDRIASTNSSSHSFVSVSVGSIIRVPATGKLIVGAWKP